MEFCITYTSPTSQDLSHIKDVRGKVLLFQTQRAAMKWIVKYGYDENSYAVDPYHNLEIAEWADDGGPT